MIELSRHIEVLLLENDCVIVPGLGGFIAHYTPATQAEESIHLPPTRTIGFNPQLKLNDGLLVQSYMSVYDTNFSDATKIVEEEVSELIARLHKDGKVDMDNVGEIRYTIHDTYEFAPYDNKITTPYLYGLDSFEMKELTALCRKEERTPPAPILRERKRSLEIPISREMLRSAVAVAAAIVLFFFLSTPVENTYVEKGNYARLLPVDLFEKIEKQSIAMTPVVIHKATKQSKAPGAPAKKTEKKATRPVAVREIKVAQPTTPHEAVATPKQAEGNFHIIVAGGIGMKDAKVMAEQLKAKGFPEAKVLDGEGKIRVSIMSYTTREEGTKQLLKLRENDTYKTAWLLVK